MEISMDLGQACRFAAQFPAPSITCLFDGAKEIFRDERVPLGITIRQPHNTFTMADQLTQPAPIQIGIPTFHAMDRGEIAGHSDRPPSIQGTRLAGL